ncbi:MAG: GntR family transcriptional regulator [Bacteroidia bacterium]|nr:GntR family transcriptional regulator [Bacteroidia bacterium]
MIVEIGKFNSLQVLKKLDFGIYLDGKQHGEILMPRQYVPEGTEIGDTVDCFIYYDSEDRIIATTLHPMATVDEFAVLRVVSVNQSGAFLFWGLPKDILVPYSEQKTRMTEDKSYVVFIYVDSLTKRIVASSKIEKFLSTSVPEYEEGQEVALIVYQKTDIGYKVVIDGKHTGVIHFSDVFKNLFIGDKLKGYVKSIKDDIKINIVLQKPGYTVIDDISRKILEYIKSNHGFVSYTDKTPADVIYREFGISKKTFKKSVGLLYKKRLLIIENNGLRVINN